MRTEDGYVIQQCLDGKPGAFGLLVEKYKKGVYALAYSEIHNFHDAQDITQEVFIKAFQNLHTLKRWDNFMGWLCRITLNTCKNWIRTASRRPDSEYMEDQEQSRLDHSAMESYNEDIVNESVREALDSLPEMYRQVLSLRYFGGMTVSEISEFLSVSKRTIDRRISEAQAKLREEIPTMLDIVKIRHDLPAGFTFRIVEIVKGIRIHPIPPIKAVPLGLSLAIGIIAGFLSIGTHLNFTETIGSFINSSGESKVLNIGEFPVDVMKVSNVSVMSKGQMNGNGLGSVVPSLQNALFMAPQAGDTWTKKADIPAGRHYISCSALNGKIYAMGGCEANRVSPRLDEYDPITDTWTQKADMPTARWGLSTCVVDGKIYAIGGDNFGAVYSVTEEYDPAIDKWTKKADMPTARWAFSMAVVNGKIYVMGGGTGITVLGGAIYPDKSTSSVEEYDPVTDTWVKKGDMLLAFCGSASAVVKDKIYLMGGGNEDHKDHAFSTVWEYDPIKDIWTKKADMPTPRSVLTAAVVNDRIYAIGGGKSMLEPIMYSVVEEYDLTTDKWTKKADMPTARGTLSADTVNGKIYAVGGLAFMIDFSKVVEEYDPGTIDETKGINFKGKLPTTWGETKTALNR
jgi:RNA polymerase sigma factor (sigma-70 family)